MKINKTKYVQIRVTEEESEKYKTLASNNGMTLSEYVRYLLKREIRTIEKSK